MGEKDREIEREESRSEGWESEKKARVRERW